MKAKDYTRKTQALPTAQQAVERYTTELRSKVEQIQQDLVGQHQQARRDPEGDGAAKRDHYARADQAYRRCAARAGHPVGQGRLGAHRSASTPERIGPLLLQRDQAREALQKAEAEQQRAEGESKAEAEQRQQQARESYARAWVGQKQALLEHVRQTHPVFTDPAKGNSEWAKIDRTLKA